MKKPISVSKVLAVAAAAVMALTLAGTAFASVSQTGNGAPSGSHYNLNIIGVPKSKNANDPNWSSGNRIFVSLSGKTKILLQEGSPYEVIDANGTDGTATFQLPGPNEDGAFAYSVWARPVGKPGGSANMTTCATDPTTGEYLCSVDSYLPVRSKGKSTFTNVSKDLLYVTTTTGQKIPIFDPSLENYFWSYDNYGLKVLQLRFYPITN